MGLSLTTHRSPGLLLGSGEGSDSTSPPQRQPPLPLLLLCFLHSVSPWWLRGFSSLSRSGYFHPVSMPLLVLTLRSEARAGPLANFRLSSVILKFPLSEGKTFTSFLCEGNTYFDSYPASFLWPPPAILWLVYRPMFSSSRFAPHCPAQVFPFLFKKFILLRYN